MKRTLLAISLIFCFWIASAQSEQSEYLEAKRLFNNGQYSSAKASFAALSQSKTFGSYAQFYFALSAYKQGDTKVARDSWKQLMTEYPNWEQKGEVLFWLMLTAYETEKFDEALKYGQDYNQATLNSEQEQLLMEKYFSEMTVGKLDTLASSYPDNKMLGTLLLKKLNAQPYQDRDFVRINELVSKWGFDLADFESIDLPVIRKDTYNIAVVLPFLFESLDNTSLISQNSLVMDMYQGMQLAAEDLGAINRPVKLFPYDTRRKKDETITILNSPGFDQNDMILGPLYPGPNEAINAYSIENQVNTLNPISSNADVIGKNPFSFLLKPSYSTLAIKTAELAIEENKDNPYAMIFYEESERDSTYAAIYKSKIEQAGFEVVLYQSINKDNAKTLLDTLAATYYNYLTEEEADSVNQIKGRFVRSRRVRSDEKERMKKDTSFVLPISLDDNEEYEIVYYEEPFYMAPDSVGHILAATRSNLFANNMISVTESRRDSIKLYGYGDWLEFTMLSYNQLDRLAVALNNPEYMDINSFSYQNLKDRIIERYKTNPSINHYRGYEAVWFAGRMMHRHGKYFQRGLRSGNIVEGKVFEGYKYGLANDNQIVPIVRFKNAKLEVVNRDLYEDRKK
ncbi:hypothetical protein [Marinoscillum sp.]|uniref:hypothetical protein n=1 Tax=Marinoscillum sp. TaxID=2024838 RepID=UPI003BAC6C4D